jgi:hypothetical protein
VHRTAGGLRILSLIQARNLIPFRELVLPAAANAGRWAASLNTMKKPKMVTPKGFIPTTFRVIGFLWVCYFVAFIPYSLYVVWENIHSQYPPLQQLVYLVESLFGALLVAVPLSLPSIFLSGFFPSVRFENKGIIYKFLFLGGLVRWNEIKTVVRVKRPVECLAVVISRPFAILSGLWFLSSYGRIVGVGKPVVLLTMNWEDRDELLQKVQELQSEAAQA